MIKYILIGLGVLVVLGILLGKGGETEPCDCFGSGGCF